MKQTKRMNLREAERVLGVTDHERVEFGSDQDPENYEDLALTAAKAAQQFRESLGTPSQPRVVQRGTRPMHDWLRKIQRAASMFRESNSSAALGFLMRKGISTACNDWYMATERKWQEYARIEGSTTVAEWYGPLFGSVIAGPVGRGGQFPEGRIVGDDSMLRNVKFGLVEAFERELFDDDQTAQIRERAQHLGASMGVCESIWASSRLIGAARTYANIVVPASGYATVNPAGTAITTPFSTSLYGTYGNRPSTYTALNMNALKTAYNNLLIANDPLENIIAVNPNVLVVSAMDFINAQLLLAPGMYPAVIGQPAATLGGTSTTAGTSQGPLTGFPGGWNSPNPFGNMGLKLVMERYLPSWAWLLGEAGKGFVFQERDPLEVVQETPNSGVSFSFDVVRFRSRRRFEADWIGGGSRFWYMGNDGSVTGQN